MAQETKHTNGIFTYALIGALLFVAAFSYTVVHFASIVTFKLSHTIVDSTLVAASGLLLFMALRGDKTRLREV